MKKIVVLFLAIAMLLGSMSMASAGELEFWNDKMTNLDAQVLESLTGAMKANGADVTVIAYPDVAAYQTALQQSIDSESAPGMFTWWSGDQLAMLVKNGLLMDLTEEWEKYYVPAGVNGDVAASLSYDGKVYAAPYAVVNNTVIYNKKAFEKAGCQEPKTFDEFLAVCDKLLAAGITPIGLKDDAWAGFIWFQQLLAVYDPQLYVGICDGTIAYNDSRVVEVMQVWRTMLDKGYFAKPVAYLDTYKAFARGEVAMQLEPTGFLPTLTAEYGMVSGEDFDAMLVPSANGGKRVIFIGITPLAIPAATADPESAKQAVRAFLSAETQTIMANNLGVMANTLAVCNDPTMAKINGFGADSDNVTLMLRYYENTPVDIRDFALDELSRFIYSGAAVEDVVNAIQTKADEVFAK